MRFDQSGLSTDILLSMTHENDFRDLNFCKKIVGRIFREKNFETIQNLLSRASPAFVFSDNEFKKEIINEIYL